MNEKGPDMSRRGFLGNAAKLAAGAMLVKVGITGAEAQESTETQEGRIQSADRIARLTMGAALSAKEQGKSILDADEQEGLRKRIFGGQDPAAGIKTFETEEKHLLTALQKNAETTYKNFTSQLDAYSKIIQTTLGAEGAHQAVLNEVEKQREESEKSGSVPALMPASLSELSLEDNARANAERMREAALTLARANDALLNSAKK